MTHIDRLHVHTVVMMIRQSMTDTDRYAFLQRVCLQSYWEQKRQDIDKQDEKVIVGRC